jgi:hypothetical protein
VDAGGGHRNAAGGRERVDSIRGWVVMECCCRQPSAYDGNTMTEPSNQHDPLRAEMLSAYDRLKAAGTYTGPVAVGLIAMVTTSSNESPSRSAMMAKSLHEGDVSVADRLGIVIEDDGGCSLWRWKDDPQDRRYLFQGDPVGVLLALAYSVDAVDETRGVRYGITTA